MKMRKIPITAPNPPATENEAFRSLLLFTTYRTKERSHCQVAVVIIGKSIAKFFAKVEPLSAPQLSEYASTY
jgi:hypothetical protein